MKAGEREEPRVMPGFTMEHFGGAICYKYLCFLFCGEKNRGSQALFN